MLLGLGALGFGGLIYNKFKKKEGEEEGEEAKKRKVIGEKYAQDFARENREWREKVLSKAADFLVEYLVEEKVLTLRSLMKVLALANQMSEFEYRQYVKINKGRRRYFLKKAMMTQYFQEVTKRWDMVATMLRDSQAEVQERQGISDQTVRHTIQYMV